MDMFNFPTYFTTNIMSLFSAFFIADSLAKRYNMKSNLIGISAVLVQLILCVSITETGWDVSSLGAEGLFVSIIGGIFVVEVTRLMEKYHLVIRMPESVPPMVAESFSILIPLAVNIIAASAVAMCCVEFAGTAFPKIIISLLAPAISSMDSVWAVAIVVLLTQLLWVYKVMVDLEKLSATAMEIITYSGVAKSTYIQAMQFAKQHRFCVNLF